MLQVVHTPQMSPACCLFCPTSVRERYVDTGMQMDFYGAVYICGECVREHGQLLGMLTEDQTVETFVQTERLTVENYELKRKIASLEAGLHGLVDAGYLDRSALSRLGSESPHSSDEVSSSGDGNSADGSSGTEALVGSGARASTEPSDDQGLGVVHADDRSHADTGFHI